MPYISYVDLASWLNAMYTHTLDAFGSYYAQNPDLVNRSAVGFQKFCSASPNYSDVFIVTGKQIGRAHV